MRFGEKVVPRALAHAIGVNFTSISKFENGKMDLGDYPSEEMIQQLAEALVVNDEELLLLSEKILTRIRKRVLVWPNAFGRLANLEDDSLERLLYQLNRRPAFHAQ